MEQFLSTSCLHVPGIKEKRRTTKKGSGNNAETDEKKLFTYVEHECSELFIKKSKLRMHI